MAGMRDERWLGYDDSYTSTESARLMYIATWDSLYWSGESLLSLTSNAIVLRPGISLPPDLREVQLAVVATIRKARL
jgi:hypothetical protein